MQLVNEALTRSEELAVKHRARLSCLKGIAIAGLMAGAMLALPSVAVSQTRGTLQVTVTVLQAQVSYQGLEAATQAAQNWATSQAVTNDVTTVAQVRVAFHSTASDQGSGGTVPGHLEVSIDYLKN